jgi:predicted short-subunit dehydrogenase-like oxidoreductase (DUF2520 family)
MLHDGRSTVLVQMLLIMMMVIITGMMGEFATAHMYRAMAVKIECSSILHRCNDLLLLAATTLRGNY